MKARFLALAALVLGLASCQTEPEGLDVNVGGEVDTFVTVAIPDVDTRANSAESGIKNLVNATDSDIDYTIRYIFEVYYGDNGVQKQVYYTDGQSASFPVRLVPGRDYNFVAWADIVEQPADEKMNKALPYDGNTTDVHYNTTNLKAITLLGEWNAMDETRDAYTGFHNTVGGEKYTGTSSITIEMIRPFAKLRVVTTDMVELSNLNIVPHKAIVTYTTKFHESFNACTGEYGAETVEKAHSTAFNIKEYSDFDNTDKEDTHKVLFTDYFFADDSDVVKFVMNVNEENGALIKSNNFSTDIPVQRNYLTTISGNILTDGNNINVKVEDAFAQPEIVENIVEVKNATDLQKAINESTEETTIVLGGDIVLGDDIITFAATRAEAPQYALLVPADKVVNLDLNGKTIRQEKECTANYSMLVNKGTLTIKGNGKISFKDTGAGDPNYGWGSYTIRNEGTLTVENGTIEHLGEQDAHMICAIFQYSGHSTINGGKISTPNYRSARLWSGDMTINGGEFEGQLWLQAVNDTSDLTINGGTFAPRGGDSSSVFVSNSGYSVKFAVNGGHFTTKIGMSEPFGCITGGTFTATAKEGTNEALLNSDYHFVDNSNGTWSVVEKPAVAKIGDVEYKSLIAAVAAVQDGDTITLVANETFTEKNYYDNGGWKDGLGYAGDKSFTIDLNSKTVSQDGSLNDYLIWIKNVGSKANTITIKNGTLDAGKTAYCALCTASSHDNKLTINLENVTLYNEIYNGSTVKVRAGSVVNVKEGTKIIGKNSYLGIECSASTVNIYDGAEIYMNGTSSYNGCLVGVGGNGTINVYGGYGKGVKGGFIAMTSGGTINVEGGEWIANTDGSIGNNSNLYVLTAQSNKYESGFAGPSIINVTGGTLRGGMDAWVLNNLEGEKAELNISGGNFNVDPTRYLADGCEANKANDIWTVRVAPVAKIGETEYETLEAAVAAAKAGDTITLTRDVTLSAELTLPAGIIFDGNGKQINGTICAGGNLTFAGHTKVTSFSASYYNRVITIGEGACLEVTGGGRVTLGYGNTFNITGSIENAKNADKATIQPSLIVPAGISITGGNDAAMNVTNAYVQIGSTTSKPGAADGKFTFNFNNSIAEFSKEFGFYEPTGGKTPEFEMNITNSVFTTAAKLCVAAANSKITVDNSVVTLGTYLRNSGVIELKNDSVMTGSTIQFGENGGNNGAITVDNSKLTITATSTGHALDGKDTGSIISKNGAEVSVTYYKAMTINVDATSTFTGTEVQ